MSIKSRIFQVIDYKRVSILAFEKALGFSNSYIRNTKNISAENCAKILSLYPDISAEWLMRGQGEMLKTEQTISNNTHSFNSNADEIIRELTSVIKKQDERIKQLTDKLLGD